MKKIFTLFLMMGSAAMLMLASCKKDEAGKVTLNSASSKGAVLASSTTTPALSKSTLSNTAITFSASSPNYGYSAAATNTLQFATKGTNFAVTTDVALTAGAISKTYTVQDFNNLLLSMNLPTGTASQLDVRVKSSLSTTVGIVYSNTVTITATPFALITYVYTPGSMQNTDPNKQWHPETADSLVSATGNGVYLGYLHFSAGDHFKITPAKGWAVAYGDAGGGKVSTTGGDIAAPGAGLYQIKLDLNAGTLEFTKYDHQWSVIGDGAKGWDPGNDVDMIFDINSNAYLVTTALKKSGFIKFRADHDWVISYGDVSPVNGQLTSNNGGNIAVPADGNYQISFSFGNPLAPTYTLVKQ